MSTLNNLHDQEIPTALFKYQSNYTFVERMLKQNKIYLSNHRELNDPFDLFFHIPNEEYDKFLTQEFGVNSFYSDMIKLPVISTGVTKWMTDKGDEMRDKLLIYSMSSARDERLMWGYYGGSYTGVCIELNFEFEIPEMVKYIYPVSYCLKNNEFPKFSMERRALDIISHKHESWVHEREYRLAFLDDGKGGNLLTFSKEIIRSITFGYKANPKKIESIINLCSDHGYNHVTFHKWEVINNTMVLSDLPKT